MSNMLAHCDEHVFLSELWNWIVPERALQWKEVGEKKKKYFYLDFGGETKQ